MAKRRGDPPVVAGQRHARRAGLVTLAIVSLFVLVLLPFGVTSVVRDILAPSSRNVYRVLGQAQAAPTRSLLRLDIVALDEWDGTVTIRVSGTHICETACDWSDRLIFVSEDRSDTDLDLGEGLPPSATVTLPPASREVTRLITLPILGEPIRYPVDPYDLELGVIMERVYPDGRVEQLSPEAAVGHLFLSLRMRAPRATMGAPERLDPRSVVIRDYQYVGLARLTFQRPLYLQVLSVLLVLLVTAAAAYAVFLRPLADLIGGAGALVLGVWGIRAV